jgi:flagellar motor protein MotB
MKRSLTIGLSAVLFLRFAAAGQEAIPQRHEVAIYTVTVIERTTKAINYQYGSGPTVIDFRGTVLMPESKGEATVESKRGRTEIDVKVDNLVPPTRFGRQYLTYTLWAITPEGAPHNIGEVIPNGSNKARMHVSTDLQAFGLIVTAEPYSASRQPSDVVVLENQVRADTMGRVKEIQAKYELMPRGHYTWDVANKLTANAAGMPVSMDRYEAVLELYEAQNAVGIARAGGAEQYAPQTLGKAQEQLAEAQRLEDSKAAASLVVQVAREAAQTAEDARAIAEKRRQEEKVATAEEAVATAKRAQARAEGEAQRVRIEADSARAEVEAERNARKLAEADAADANRRAQEPAVIIAPSPPPASMVPPQADSQKTALRMRLLEQLNAGLATRDTPRGLVATVPDASFGGSEVGAPASDRIGRIVAILAPYPELRIAVEGHSDSATTQSLCCIARSRRVFTTPGCAGFSRNQKAFRSWTSEIAWSRLPNPVRTTVGVRSPRAANSFSNATPSIRGITRSVKMALAGRIASLPSASRPSTAAVT